MEHPTSESGDTLVTHRRPVSHEATGQQNECGNPVSDGANSIAAILQDISDYNFNVILRDMNTVRGAQPGPD